VFPGLTGALAFCIRGLSCRLGESEEVSTGFPRVSGGCHCGF
jgi:hypothetical protein